MDAQAVSTDERATLYTNDQTHMFGRKEMWLKNNGGVLNIKKTKPSIFFFFLPKAVFEHVYISTLLHSCTVVKQYKELTTKILSITFLILVFLTIHLSHHREVNVLFNLTVISQILIKFLYLCLETCYTVYYASPLIIPCLSTWETSSSTAMVVLFPSATRDVWTVDKRE